jgi:dienelactone hydrolase
VDLAQYIAPVSNYSGNGPTEVGTYRGMTQFGLYDVAGNVKEWCWNEAGSGWNWIRGGAWSEPIYTFGQKVAASAFSREPQFGFRCVIYREAPSKQSLAPTSASKAPYLPRKLATPEELALYRKHYLYDKHLPLNPSVVSANQNNEHYRQEIVEIDAAYSNERFGLYLFYPKKVEPPFQPILFHPGAGSMNAKSIGQGNFFGLRFVKGLVSAGRVVCWPVYQGTFERNTKAVPIGSIQHRDANIQRVKDAMRAIDYLETLPDLDIDKLAYAGFSWGAGKGPAFIALESRFRLGVFACGGLFPTGRVEPGEINTANYAPLVKVPILMINGRFDQFFPLEESQLPLFQLLGSHEKKQIHFDTTHATPEKETIQLANDWLDRHLGSPMTIRD